MIEIIVKGLKMPKAIFYLLTFIFLLTIIGCSSEQAQSSKPGVLKQPGLKIKTSEVPEAVVKLPLLLWSSFEYRKINLKPGWSDTVNRETFCVINETDGIPIETDTKVEFIEDARCFHTYFTSADGIPHKYIIGLVKIRIPETGEEGWTWISAVDLKE